MVVLAVPAIISPEGVKTYSPTDVSITVGGKYKIDVFNSVAVATAEARLSHKAASTGQLTRTINANKLGTITLVLPQTTVKNAELLAEFKRVLSNYSNATGFTSIDVKDNLGQSIHRIIQASITKVPDANYDKDATDRTWVFEGGLFGHDVKGNADF